MITILKVGYSAFAFKSKKHAVAALAALSEGMAVESKYVKSQEVFFPQDHRRERALSIENIHPDRLLAQEPEDVIPEERQLKA